MHRTAICLVVLLSACGPPLPTGQSGYALDDTDHKFCGIVGRVARAAMAGRQIDRPYRSLIEEIEGAVGDTDYVMDIGIRIVDQAYQQPVQADAISKMKIIRSFQSEWEQTCLERLSA